MRGEQDRCSGSRTSEQLPSGAGLDRILICNQTASGDGFHLGFNVHTVTKYVLYNLLAEPLEISISTIHVVSK